MISRRTAAFVLFLEGLASSGLQMITLRQTVPFVGSSILTTSIVISIFLGALALGYYWGGQQNQSQYTKSLIRNLLISISIFGIGLSYSFVHIFFSSITEITKSLPLIHNPLVHLGIFCLVIMAPLVFFLAQTVPLILNVASQTSTKSKAAGNATALSTLGSVAGCFVHKNHHKNKSLPRFAGWWGHDKETRFKMENDFKPIASAEAWQVSNPPVLSLAAIRGSLDTIKKAGGIKILRKKAIKLTGFLRFLIEDELANDVDILTPRDLNSCGSQLSLAIKLKAGDSSERGKEIFDAIEEAGVTADWRYPNVIRVAPVAQYNSFKDVFNFKEILLSAIRKNS